MIEFSKFKKYRAVFKMKLNVSQAIRFIEKELPPTEDRDEKF